MHFAKIGERMRHYRMCNNLTQGELAEIIKVSRQAINNMENGRAGPKFDVGLRILFLLDIDVKEAHELCGFSPALPLDL